MATSTRTIGIIRLAEKPEAAIADKDPQDLASTLKWLVGEVEDAVEYPGQARSRFHADSANDLQPAKSVCIRADMETIYSQLEDEYQRLLPC